MGKVHITLVGGQPAPVYNGILATQPDKVVYIYSDESRPIVEILKSVVKVDFDDIPPIDPIDPHKIKKLVLYLAEKYKNDEITVNISSGLKSWTFFFSIVFDKMTNAAIVYMDQNNVLWNYKNMTHTTEFAFDMHMQFRLYGNPIENHYKSYSSYNNADHEALVKVENIRTYNYIEFNSLLSVLDKNSQHKLEQQNSGRFDLPSGSYVEWEKSSSEKNGFVRINLVKRGERHEVLIESPHAVDIAFNSGWFELKVANLLSRWDKSKEICLNCKFPYKQGIAKNEADIIVDTGSKILFVECKTQINNTTDIDKFRSVVKGYGGMGSKALFVTDALMTEMAKEKCEEHGILTFSLKDSHLGMTTEKALFFLLNNELYSINTK